MPETAENTAPFRWDLIRPDQLGSLLSDVEEPDLWFLDDLVKCAGKVLARSGNGELIFVGRSLDSMFDLLGGALAGEPPLHRLPVSLARPLSWSGTRKARYRAFTAGERVQAQRALTAVGVTPSDLARRKRPATFVDVVSSGSTFTDLFWLLRDWIEAENQPWAVIRRKVRFLGVTYRRPTSPKTFRWQQHAAWTAQLPAGSVRNVSLDGEVLGYFADAQPKLTRRFHPERWLADADGPNRDQKTRQALAEAVAVVAHGRSVAGRRGLSRAINGEPGLAQPWLRSLTTRLNTSVG